MSSGRFTAVVHGTWETSARPPVVPAFGLLIAAALLSWLATLLWLLAAVLGVLLTLAFGGLVVIRRYNRRDYGRHLARMAALAEAEPERAVTAPSAQALTVNNFHGETHLHYGDGSADPRIIQAIPERDAIAEEIQ